MCEDCLPGFQGFSSIFALFRNDKEIVGENGVVNSKCCCCCGVSLDDDDDNALFSTYLLLKTLSWDIFECAKKENLITAAGDIYDSGYSELCVDDENVTVVKEFEAAAENENGNEVLEVGVKMESVEDKAMLIMKDKSVQACIEKDMSTQDLEFCLDYSGNKLVPIESFDWITEEEGNFLMIEDHENAEDQSSSKGYEVQVEENEGLEMNEEPKFAMRESMEMEEDENSLFFHAKDRHLESKDERDVQETGVAAGEMNLDTHTDIPGLDITDGMQNQELYECTHQVCGTEESVDGSVTSELEVISDGAVTIERLKSALRSERNALEALYEELEEERSASEVAANQTMAMINRLQEEKAAIQMEAIQYQRLMEEQSEYDQQALQILNDLIVEREKVNQELEKELEMYKRVLKRSNLPIDINQEFGNQNTGFEECLAGFEDERLSILGQLRVLEEKLVTLDDENGFVKKTLFPLFDEMGDENGNGFVDSNGMHNCSVSVFERGNKKLASEERMDHMYVRKATSS
ncbi:hypothetical protein PHJA_001808300 [Phtheirospermum japonicum]|uniref:GTD-binding domain-containing protein n=1 Tax=Phtheirospermum japonicum TaxID=374723 RepID=A0A830CE78_9LAMI|nr:hypothetical protein PHJA_001808300 [Phtheirospermum japonicum]